jgi:hypothetical protein
MSSKVFGTRDDGTLTVCRALPENRGTGTCRHAAHIELSEEQLKTGYLRTFNEEAVRKSVASGVETVFATVSKAKAESAGTRKRRNTAAFAKLLTEATELEPTLPRGDFDLVKSVYGDFAKPYGEEAPLDRVAAMESYLTSDAPTAVKLREYLGPDTNYPAISDLLMNEVGGMTTAHRWSTSGRHSISRVILTALHNDMDRENYVASVLYFKGKCCYCQKTLGRNAGGKIALPTGEHITPITPQQAGAPVGGTRFGNVALACNRCNKSRGNEELHAWLKQKNGSGQDMVPAEALARINAFRKFSGYTDYTPEETELVRKAAMSIQGAVNSLRNEEGRIVREVGHGDVIRDRVAAKLLELEKLIPPRGAGAS